LKATEVHIMDKKRVLILTGIITTILLVIFFATKMRSENKSKTGSMNQEMERGTSLQKATAIIKEQETITATQAAIFQEISIDALKKDPKKFYSKTPGGNYLLLIKGQLSKQLEMMSKVQKGDGLAPLEKIYKKISDLISSDKLANLYSENLLREMEPEEVEVFLKLSSIKNIENIQTTLNDYSQLTNPSMYLNNDGTAKPAEIKPDREALLREIIREGQSPDAQFEMGFYLSSFAIGQQPESQVQEIKTTMKESFTKFFEEAQEKMIPLVNEKLKTTSTEELRTSANILSNPTYKKGVAISIQSTLDYLKDANLNDTK